MKPGLSIIELTGPIRRHGATLMLGAVLLGLAWPALAESLRPALPLGVLLVNIALFLQVSTGQLARETRRGGPLLAMLAWTLVASPLAVFGVVNLLPLSPEEQASILLYAMAPTAGTAVAVAALMGLDAALLIVLRLATCLAAPLLIPTLAALLLPGAVSIDAWAMAAQLALFVLVPAFIAPGLRRLPGVESCGRELGSALAVLGLMVVGVAMMDGMRALWLRDAEAMARTLGLAFATATGLQVLGSFVFARWGVAAAMSLGLACGHRNASLLWAAIVPLPAADTPMAAFFAMAVAASFALTWLSDVGMRVARSVGRIDRASGEPSTRPPTDRVGPRAPHLISEVSALVPRPENSAAIPCEPSIANGRIPHPPARRDRSAHQSPTPKETS